MSIYLSILAEVLAGAAVQRGDHVKIAGQVYTISSDETALFDGHHLTLGRAYEGDTNDHLVIFKIVQVRGSRASTLTHQRSE